MIALVQYGNTGSGVFKMGYIRLVRIRIPTESTDQKEMFKFSELDEWGASVADKHQGFLKLITVKSQAEAHLD